MHRILADGKNEDGLYCSDHRNPGSEPAGWLQAQVSAKPLTCKTFGL